VEIYTIGFTQKTAERFFGTLRKDGIKRLIDVRLNNTSQLAGFTRRDDLAYFLREIIGAEYQHDVRLAPTAELLDAYRKGRIKWAEYETRFNDLMAERQIEKVLEAKMFAGPSVLLCSEPTAERCHRRLIVEYLQKHWPDVKPVHL
jgi:uncharacterized protein (DUF488 family)